MMGSRIFILLPVHNRRETTRRFIECLLRQSWKHYQLILIDDGSTDGTADMAEDAIDDLVLIRGRGTWWWAGSLQKGLDWLKAARPSDDDFILFINDDVTFDDHFLQAGMGVLGEMPDHLLLARMRDPATGAPRETGVHADVGAMRFVIAPAAEQINCLSTRGLFVRWALARRIGDFHPRILPHYLSDYEWTMRARRLGIRYSTDARFVLESPDLSRSGDPASASAGNPLGALGKIFSTKSQRNPFHRSAFVVLASPWYTVPYRLLKVWGRFFKAFCGTLSPRDSPGGNGE
jgi:glycosyltransferase involved in cell wall biosynthesis